MRIGISSPQDFLALLVRRKWWIIFPFVAMSSLAVVLTAVLPGLYVSETLILVQPRDVPEDFVMDLIAGSTQQRLTTIEQTVLSRTNLIQVLRQFEDELEDFGGTNMDARVARLREQISISFQLEDGAILGRQELTSFRIAYQDQNPELAQKIAAELTSLFIEQDNRVRETQVFGTTEFLNSELAKVREELRVSDDALKVIRASHQFELPEQLDTNLRTLERLQLQQQTNAEALDRYAAMRLNLERQLSETPEMIVETGPAAPAAAENPLIAQYREARLAHEEAEDKFTSEHPAVRIARARLDRLEEQIPPEDQVVAQDPAPVSTTLPNPVYQSLVAQLEEVQTEFEIREREKAFIEAEIRRYSQRVENTPQAELEIAELSRRNEDLQEQYDDLRAKLSQAQLAESLESRQKGEQFEIVDPANYPLEPSKPNKPMVAIAGVLGSLAAAIAFGTAVDVLRQRVWTPTEVEAFWGAPVLVDIPEILTDSDLEGQRRTKWIWAASSLGGAAVYAFSLYLVYLKHEPIIQQLDPILQRLVYR